VEYFKTKENTSLSYKLMSVSGYIWVHKHEHASCHKGKIRLRSFTSKRPAL